MAKDGQEMVYNGLSARPSEMHAAVALSGIRNADGLVKARRRLIGMYRDRLGNLPGCRVQEYPHDRETSGNYFTLLVGPRAKVDRNSLYETLKSNDIQSKKYFYPPVHLQKAFVKAPGRIVGDLGNTIEASDHSLALPLFSHMSDDQLERICHLVRNELV